jgi:hypothetical protein
MYYCDRYSCILYSNQTRSQIQTDQQFPSVGSQTKGLLVNADGSVDIYFGLKPPAGKDLARSNCLGQPGKSNHAA